MRSGRVWMAIVRMPVLAIALSGAVIPQAMAVEDLRAESLKLYGGTYSPDCANATAPKVRIAVDGLQITGANRNVRTAARMDSYTSFGGAPTSAVPAGYKVEFIGDDFSLYVFEDAKGLYVPLEGYVPSAADVVGAANMKARFGRCNG